MVFLENTNNNLKALLKSADTALYRARASGRSRVCSYIELIRCLITLSDQLDKALQCYSLVSNQHLSP